MLEIRASTRAALSWPGCQVHNIKGIDYRLIVAIAYKLQIVRVKFAGTHRRQGQHSIRINSLWRVCFVWADGHATNVEIVDDHGRSAAMPRKVPPIHPGVILLEDWLTPMGSSQYTLAKAIDVPPRRINEIVKGLRGITVDTALRLSVFFGPDAQSWINLQTHYDTEPARVAMAGVLGRIVKHEVPEAA